LYWDIAIVLLPWQAVSIVSSFSIAASIARLHWQDPCCLSKGDVF
jgi:precorrin-6B methylase 1